VFKLCGLWQVATGATSYAAPKSCLPAGASANGSSASDRSYPTIENLAYKLEPCTGASASACLPACKPLMQQVWAGGRLAASQHACCCVYAAQCLSQCMPACLPGRQPACCCTSSLWGVLHPASQRAWCCMYADMLHAGGLGLPLPLHPVIQCSPLSPPRLAHLPPCCPGLCSTPALVWPR
jgi:hypothetical protein